VEHPGVLIIHNILSPYRLHEFECLGRRDGINLTVVFLREGDERRPWRVLPPTLNFRSIVLGKRGGSVPGTVTAILKEKPDIVIVGGWDEPAFISAHLLKRLCRYRLVIWMESTKLDRRPPSRWRALTKRRLIRHADALLCAGRASAEFATELGATRIFVAPNSTDNAFFERGATTARHSARHELAPPTAMFVGRLSNEKGVDVLLHAWAQIEHREPLAHLVVVGSGPEEAALKTLADGLGLTRTEWVPFVQQQYLPRLYARASVLVLPSRSESWGFVVNEAMACGVPVIASDAVGAAADLLDDGVTGFRFPSEDHDALRARLIQLLRDPDLCRQMGAEAKHAVSVFTPERWADAMEKLICDLPHR
jgi:glycosyltransferase involved in cell wall biosynthesis